MPIVLAFLLIMLACGGPPTLTHPSPQPFATPTPSPTPYPFDPIRAQGDRWNREIVGLSACCGHGGWPQIDQALLHRWALAGGNLVHLRLGPYWNISEGLQFNGYESVDAKADLSRFRPQYWSALRDLATASLQLGVALEIDLIDGWPMRPAYQHTSPWLPVNNTQKLDVVGCEYEQGPLLDVHEKWTRKAVYELGMFPNVLWHLGNENFLCDVSAAWETDMTWVIRDEESKRGYSAHLIGSNSQSERILTQHSIDYSTWHEDSAIEPKYGKPTAVNEYPSITPAQYAIELDRARQLGTRFDLWLGDATETDLVAYLEVVKNHVH